MAKVNLDGYYQDMELVGLYRGCTVADVEVAAERELAYLDDNEPGHGLDQRDLEMYFERWCKAQ